MGLVAPCASWKKGKKWFMGSLWLYLKLKQWWPNCTALNKFRFFLTESLTYFNSTFSLKRQNLAHLVRVISPLPIPKERLVLLAFLWSFGKFWRIVVVMVVLWRVRKLCWYASGRLGCQRQWGHAGATPKLLLAISLSGHCHLFLYLFQPNLPPGTTT